MGTVRYINISKKRKKFSFHFWGSKNIQNYGKDSLKVIQRRAQVYKRSAETE